MENNFKEHQKPVGVIVSTESLKKEGDKVPGITVEDENEDYTDPDFTVMDEEVVPGIEILEDKNDDYDIKI